ncbi:MAG: DUF4175 domain-containing protein [Bdellovibrionales bacterium]
MVTRSPRPGSPSETGNSGSPRLILAKWILRLEAILGAFARPLLFAGLFLALAWLGVFTELYPWAHLAVLAVFVLIFFDAVAKARAVYRAPSLSSALRRIEEASHLQHRPLDTLTDRPAVEGKEQNLLWQAHLERCRAQLQELRWPRWKLSFADRDPYALRYALLVLLGVAVFTSWGIWGGRLLAAVNPSLGPSLALFRPPVDAWITPPDYTGLPPIMIATPAGPLHADKIITVPEGSTITAYVAEKSGETPRLDVNGASIDFTADDKSDFGVTATIASGDKIAIHRGWRNFGTWRVQIASDRPPAVDFTDPIQSSERKSLQLGWQASDDYSVKTVTATVTPRESLAGADNRPIEIDLAAPEARDARRVSYVDLTASPFAGLPVQIRLNAVDAAGHSASSETVTVTLPERTFFHPLARALIEERRKLLQRPMDDSVRNEAANVMAGIAAHNPADYRNDPVVMMALRAGAVRLVLDRAIETMPSVLDILWQSALRIEDGSTGMAEADLRQAQKELADALDRDASEAEIQQLIDKLHQALGRYMAQLSAQADSRTPMANELERALGDRTNTLTPQDLERMLEQMRDMSASGARDAARGELARLQQLLENLRTGRPQLTDTQKQNLKRLAELRELAKKQQQLLDETFRQAHDKAEGNDLAMRQEDLRRALRSLMDGAKKDDATEDLDHGEREMQNAGTRLKQGAPKDAVPHQTSALQALQQAAEQMANNLRASLFMLPRPGAAGHDPFGRGGFEGFVRDDGSIRVPDRMESRRVREILNELQRRAGDTDRSKAEREYIDRLLQNF